MRPSSRAISRIDRRSRRAASFAYGPTVVLFDELLDISSADLVERDMAEARADAEFPMLGVAAPGLGAIRPDVSTRCIGSRCRKGSHEQAEGRSAWRQSPLRRRAKL